MTPDEHRLLEETRALVEENSKMLKSMQRMMHTSAVIKIVYWVVILGVTFGAFYFIQPYFDAIKETVGSSPESLLREL